MEFQLSGKMASIYLQTVHKMAANYPHPANDCRYNMPNMNETLMSNLKRKVVKQRCI